ncbi:MAG: hypothetical protein P1V97_11470 [Planctomycetota bacterium]|nr:hypothetical protein [Planctomycetota bacterium]
MTGRRTHKNFLDKLEEAINSPISLTLVSGQSLSGRVKEVGADYIVLEAKQGDQWVRSRHILFIAPNVTTKNPSSETIQGHIATPKKASPSAPTFKPAIQFVPEPQARTSTWNPRIKDSDQALYLELHRRITEGVPEALSATRHEVQALIDRHPGNKEIHGLKGYLGWKLGEAPLTRDGFFIASILGQRSSWLWYVHACFMDKQTDFALLGIEQIYRHKSILEAPKLWRLFLNLCAWHKEYSPLDQVLKNLEQRQNKEELELFFEDVAWLCDKNPPLTAESFRAWYQEHTKDSVAGAFGEKRVIFQTRMAKIKNDAKFAALEEDISGLIAEAEGLAKNGKINSAYNKLNEAYGLMPAHNRVRVAEQKLRGPTRRIQDPFQLSAVESTLKSIFADHDFVVFDTSVLSMQDHFSKEERELDKFLRESGKHGLSTLEEKVAYHKLIERMIETHREKIYVPQGVVEEIQDGVARMRDRKALSTFGKSAEIIRRELSRCSRHEAFDDRHADKKLRTIRSTFQRLRSRGGLSEVDFDLIIRSFVLAIDQKVALLSNDRGIHSGVEHIVKVIRGGNRNVAFLKKAQIDLYSSIQKSHFEIVKQS